MVDKTIQRKALIVMQSHINTQMDALGQAYCFLKSKFTILETSNVYLKYLDSHHGATSRGQLMVALSLETTMTPQGLNSVLQERMQLYPNAVDLFLALYEDETLLTPQLTIPHPDLHQLPFWLMPAAEIWGDAAHPILGQSLQELAGSRQWGEWGEFYAQGKVLLDFYYKQTK